jgi:hypothetical protein
VCKAGIPFNFTGLVPALYADAYGGDFIGPTNLGRNGIVYQLRVDAFQDNIYFWYHLSFQYLDGTFVNTTYGVAGMGVVYIASLGATPALVRACFYTEFAADCTPFDLVYNEVDLFQLAACSCNDSISGGNVLCDVSNQALLDTPLNRTLIPYFSTPLPTLSPPSCIFVINSENNQSAPFSQVPFSLMDLSSGGVGALTFGWRFIGSPPSAAFIMPPATASVVNAQAAAPGFYTVEHVVTDANGIFTTCVRTFQVASNALTLCTQPAGPDLNLAVGVIQPIDASCSFNPLGGPISFTWNVSSFYSPAPISLTSSIGPTTSIMVHDAGSAIVILTGSNGASQISIPLYIRSYILPPNAGPGGVPFGTPITPMFQCFLNSTPVDIPISFPPPNVPIPNLPIGPQTPMNINPSGNNPSGGLIGPAAKIPDSLLTIILIIVILVFVAYFAFRCFISVTQVRANNSWWTQKVTIV